MVVLFTTGKRTGNTYLFPLVDGLTAVVDDDNGDVVGVVVVVEVVTA